MTQIVNKIDFTKVAEVIGSANEDTKKLISALLDMVKILSEQKAPNVQAPNVSVNMDVEKLIKAIPKPEAPVVHVKNDVINEQRESEEVKPCSYEFDIERDGQGRIKKVLASPVEKIEAYL
jgi:uncharacterized protein with NRDE domain